MHEIEQRHLKNLQKEYILGLRRRRRCRRCRRVFSVYLCVFFFGIKALSREHFPF